MQKTLNFIPIFHRFALYAACKTSFRAVDPLCDILKAEFGQDALDMHHTKCIALVRKVLSPHFQKELLQDLSSTFYSLLVDESTDVSVTKLLACSVRYFSSKRKAIITTFLDILELEEADAKSLANAVNKVIAKWCLSKDKFVGLGTDGASSMIGQHNGLQALLKKDYPSLVHMRCVCHSIDLCARDAMKRTLPSNLETMIRDTYTWFSCSSSRQQAYQQIVDLIGVDSLLQADEEDSSGGAKALKLLSPCATRWLVAADCVQRILQQYDALCAHFTIAGEKDRCYDAKHLSMMYKNQENKLYLLFLYPVLKELKNLSKLFQSNTQETFKVYSSLRTYFRSLAARILKPSVLRLHTDDSLCELDLGSGFCILEDNDIDYGAKFQEDLQKSKLSATEKSYIRERCKNFLVELFKGLQKRASGCLALMTQVVQWSFPDIMSAKTTAGLLQRPFFPQDCASQGSLEEDFRKMKLISWKSHDTAAFWLEVLLYQDALGNQVFKELAEGVLRMLCLPISNGEVERVFSQVSLVKDKKRNRMKMDTLEAVLYCRFGLSRIGETSGSFVPPNRILHYDASIY